MSVMRFVAKIPMNLHFHAYYNNNTNNNDESTTLSLSTPFIHTILSICFYRLVSIALKRPHPIRTPPLFHFE